MALDSTQNLWRKCSSCKKDILYNARYQVCSVSTCNSMDLVFCSVPCWDSHLGFARHRSEAGAIEKRAPATAEAAAAAPPSPKPAAPAPKKIFLSSPPSSSSSKGAIATETLVVVSKVKNLIREQSEFNTSQCAVDALTDIVVKESLKAIEKAKVAGRKTVMGRDFEKS